MEEQPFDFNAPITEDITLEARFDCPVGITLTQFKTALDNGTATTDYPAGTQIDDTTNGTYDPFIVAHYGAQYGSPAHQGVYLMRKYIYPAQMAWGDQPSYGDSAINNWLNSTYHDGCSDSLKSMVKQINVPTNNGSIPAKFFLMSGVETIALSGSADTGVAWDYWKTKTGLTTPSTAANAGRIMSEGELTNGEGTAWWLRTTNPTTHGAGHITPDGACRITPLTTTQMGIVPACFIPVGSAEPQAITTAEFNALDMTK